MCDVAQTVPDTLDNLSGQTGGRAMRKELLVFWMLLFSVTSANAQVSIGIGLPDVSIGINLPLYPELEPVPGYPVYYAPQLNYNYFFYDGMYWVYQNDNWYASSWYNGPWGLIGRADVPLFILRVPVRYYRQPPGYFRGWQSNSPPHWGEHWGNDWAQRRSGWDHWNRNSAPAPAPLPVYQRNYAGDRYPGADQQRALQNKNYSYQPRDAAVRQHDQAQRVESAPSAPRAGTQGAQQGRDAAPQELQRANQPPLVKPSAPTPSHVQSTPRPDGELKLAPPVQQKSPQPQQRDAGQRQREQQPQQQQQQRETVQRQQPEPKVRGPEAGAQERGQENSRESGQGRGRENDREDAGGRGQDRGR
jgi:hypothetical protein